MANNPFGLFLTWTSYGTWLPGDARGYVSATPLAAGGREPKHNAPGTPYLADDQVARRLARRNQRGAAVWLSSAQANEVAASLVTAARERTWRLLRAAIMNNHVHLVVMETPDDGPAVRRVFKGVSQASLSRASERSGRWWTAGGSDRYLHGEEAIMAVARYIANQRGILAEIIDNVVQ